jgi:hypothetical protein
LLDLLRTLVGNVRFGLPLLDLFRTFGGKRTAELTWGGQAPAPDVSAGLENYARVNPGGCLRITTSLVRRCASSSRLRNDPLAVFSAAET